MARKSGGSRLATTQQHLRLLQGKAAASPELERFEAELAGFGAQLADLEVAYKKLETINDELETMNEELETMNEELETTRGELELQRHRYVDLFDCAPFGYLVTDAYGVIEEANQVAASLAGMSPCRIKGKPFAIFLAQENRKAFRSLLHRACTGEETGEWEVMLMPRDREPFPAVLNAVRDLNSPDAVRLRWTVRDVSEREAAVQALRESEERLRHSQRMETVGRLAGGIAHSFNNLLAAMFFQCELLNARLDEDDAGRGHVEEIRKAGERAATLARQLLAFGRKQVLQPRVLELNEVIRAMEPMLRRLIGEDIRLETDLDPEAGAINADAGQLEQVILNLIVNARDAMPSGGVLRLATSWTKLGPNEESGTGGADLLPGPSVRLDVEDTGAGMAPEVMERLFEPFFTTKERGKGTGLGLATVHGIVHQSGGQIQVESEPGRGTRFTILLPRAEGKDEAAQPSRGAVVERRSRIRSEVLLLVEDEENIRQPAVEILESKGYQVLAAPDATAALALAERHPGPIHLLITDVIMPGLSGSQLAETLSPLRPEMRVLFISGYPEEAISRHGVLSPAKHFLQKPFPPGQFLETVRELLDAAPFPIPGD